MLGAAEEAAAELPCGLLPAGLAEAEVESMPDALVCSPFLQLEMGSRYTNDQVCRLIMDHAQHDAAQWDAVPKHFESATMHNMILCSACTM
jgi:hypothetical protein